MQLHVHYRYARRQRAAAHLLRRHPEQSVAQTLNDLAEPHLAPLICQRISPVAQYILGINDSDALVNATPAEAAGMLDERTPEIMANCHASLMSSIWIYFGQPRDYHLPFYRDVLAIGTRYSWLGDPFIPAHRLELPDGSAFVIYGSTIMTAVHRDRIDLIADDYLKAARESIQRITANGRAKGSKLLMEWCIIGWYGCC